MRNTTPDRDSNPAPKFVAKHTAYMLLIMDVRAGVASARYLGTYSSPAGSYTRCTGEIAIPIDQADGESYQEACNTLMARVEKNPVLSGLAFLMPAKGYDDHAKGYQGMERRNAVSSFLSQAQRADNVANPEERAGILLMSAHQLAVTFITPLPK